MEQVSLSAINTIMPVISFLFVFILIYAILAKTKILGDNNMVSLFISLIIASFFIVNTNIVRFTQLTTSWFVIFVICLFMIILLLSFVGKDVPKLFTENKSLAAVIIALVILLFVISSSYTFNWIINWKSIHSWFDQEWFGMALLIVVAVIVSVVLTKEK